MSRHADATGTARFDFTAIRRPARYMSGRQIDCADPSDGCAFVIAAAADTKRSAVVPYVISP